MELIDTHCHLYFDQYKEHIDAVIERALSKGVATFYLPSIDSSHTEAMFALEKRYPKNCFLMMGLHPCSVKANYQQEIDTITSWLEQRAFVAIGEVGLDFYWDQSFAPQQYICFEKQMTLALQYQLPVIIHTRKAMAETIACMKPFALKGLRGIVHCFSGTYHEACQIIDMGFYIGIGGVVTYKNAGLAEVVKQLPIESIVLETDAPFLSPVPHRSKPNEPAFLELIASKIATLLEIKYEEVARITTENAKKIFGSIRK